MFGQQKKKRTVRLSPQQKAFESEWNCRTKSVCKPCWELKYCPYGPLVEQFPARPVPRGEMMEHMDRLRGLLKAGVKEPERRRTIKGMVENFDPKDYPIEVDHTHDDKICSVFGHYCPVFFVNEPFTETREGRRIGRNIPRAVMLRVVRRDNNQCQTCSKVLKDNEIEFDHIIPVSKGGSSEEHNVRVACFDCNRSKSDKYEP